MCRVATLLATSLLLVVSIVNAGSVVEVGAENNNRVLKSAKKGTGPPGVPPPPVPGPTTKSQKKKIKKIKSIKSPKTKSEKKKSKKAKGTDVPSSVPSPIPVITASPTVATATPSSKPSQSPSSSPISPFGPVNAGVAVPAGTGAAVVEAAVEDVATNTILQQPLGGSVVVNRKLQETSEVEQANHRMLQTPPVNTIGSITVVVTLVECDCPLISPIFPTADSCECYETTISGTASNAGLADLLLTASLQNGTFGLRLNQIIPNSTAQPVSFSTAPSQGPTVDSSVVPTVDSSVVPTVESSVVPTVESSVVPTVDSSVVPTVESSVVPTVESSVVPTVESSVVPTVESSVVPTVESSVVPTVSASESNSGSGSLTGSGSDTSTTLTNPYGPTDGNLIAEDTATDAEVEAAIINATITVLNESARRRAGDRRVLEVIQRSLQSAGSTTCQVTKLTTYVCNCSTIPNAPTNCKCFLFTVEGESTQTTDSAEIFLEQALTTGLFAEELVNSGLDGAVAQPESYNPTPAPTDSSFPSSSPMASP